LKFLHDFLRGLRLESIAADLKDKFVAVDGSKSVDKNQKPELVVQTPAFITTATPAMTGSSPVPGGRVSGAEKRKANNDQLRHGSQQE